MTSDDTPIPEDDSIAWAARRGLGAIARSSNAHAFSWPLVQTRARRMQRRRLAAVGAAGAIVLLGAGAAVAASGHDSGHRLSVARDAPSTDAPTTTIPLAYDSSSAAMTTIAGPPATGSQIAPPASGAPQVGDFAGTVTIGFHEPTPAMAIGDSVDVSAVVHNTTDHTVWSSTSLLPTALATICTSEASGQQTLWWMTNIPVPPGNSDLNSVGRDGPFRPTADYAGNVTCELDVVTTDQQGKTFDETAGGDAAQATIVGRVTAVAPVTFSVHADVPTTTTGTTGPATTIPNTTIPDTTVPDTTGPATTTTSVAP